MTAQELRAQRAKLMEEANALLPADGKITSEIRTKFEAMVKDADNMAFVISTLETEERSSLELRGRNMQLPQVGEHSEASTPEKRNAEIRESFKQYVQTGKVETRDLTASGQGILVPQLFDPSIFEAKKSYGSLASVVSTMKTASGNPMKLVYDNDTANSLAAVTSGVDATETDPTTSSATLSVDNFTTGVIKVDFALLQDAGFDVEAWIREKFATRYFRGLANNIYSGDGGAVASLATAYNATGAGLGITTSAVNTLSFKDFGSALAQLDPAYQDNAIWTVSNATLAYIVSMVDSNGRPLFIPYSDGGAAGFIGTILGKPVKLVTQMPAVATGNYPVLFGDFKAGYTLRTVGDGLGILRLNERYAAGFEVGFVGFCRLGGVATNYGVSPIVAIKIQ
jgi:HK97 family phage major capsid protein